MREHHTRRRDERRLRRTVTTVARQASDETEQPDEPDDDSAAAQRIEQHTLWVDLQIRRAMQRGDFDNLPGSGKPIPGIGGTYDPDWWVKKLIEREQITAVLPPALALRKEGAELEVRLDRMTTEQAVRRAVDDFNQRVVAARRQLLGGPPVVTPTRDVEGEVADWRTRLAARRDQARRDRERLGGSDESRAEVRRRRWWHGRGRREQGEASR